jgi:hypothetical protein
VKKHYALLLFDRTDEVVETFVVGAENLQRARQIADIVLMSRPAAVGLQLWRDGKRLSESFPEDDDRLDVPVMLMAYRRKMAGGRR